MDDLANSTTRYLSPQADFVCGSICDAATWEKGLDGVDGVFHLAALVSVNDSVIHWHRNHQVNCSGMLHLLEQFKQKPIVFASSAAVYGNIAELPHQEERVSPPLSPYAADKYSCELHAKAAWHLFKTPSAACRFFNVYGPRQSPDSPYAGVISKFAYNILHHKPIQIFGDGMQSRDFIYVQDIVLMLVGAMNKLKEGANVYNFCTGKSCTINDLADLIGKLLGIPVIKERLAARPGDTLYSMGDPTRAERELGVKAIYPLAEGLKQLFGIQAAV